MPPGGSTLPIKRTLPCSKSGYGPVDHPESFKGCERISIFFNFYTLKAKSHFLAFHIQTGSYFWYQTVIKTKPLTFLHFNWMVKECARPRKSNFKLSFFSLSILLYVRTHTRLRIVQVYRACAMAELMIDSVQLQSTTDRAMATS